MGVRFFKMAQKVAIIWATLQEQSGYTGQEKEKWNE